uniref:Uncharacterized protein n=1 Tax=Rhizophora mucronata TaxID=61149 RepID=A0A2P2QPP6_RHIMU
MQKIAPQKLTLLALAKCSELLNGTQKYKMKPFKH